MSIREINKWLQQHNYHFRKNVSKDIAIQTIGRFQRHLLSYRQCTLQELIVFCENRHLTPKVKTISSLSNTLEQADDEATFDRFLDLPPELRNTIYAMHFSDFDTVPEIHHQPPIALASSQLRKETRELFYSCGTFRVSVHRDYPLGTYEKFLSPDTVQMVQQLSTNDFCFFSRIKYLEMHDEPSYGKPFDAFSLDFTPGLSADRAITCLKLDYTTSLFIDTSGNDKLERALFPIIQAMIARSESWSLRKGDLDDLWDAC